MVPENLSPGAEGMLSTLMDSTSTKSPGSLLKSGHSIPSALILTGSHEGHLKLAPVAEPMLMKMPNPGLATKLPSPRMAKLRPSPPSRSEPIRTSAPTAPKLTSS